MYGQLSEAGPSKTNKVTHKKRNRRKKKNNINKHIFKKEKDKRRQGKTECPMSSWAENFAVAATWQLKHQVAYWKARAKSLEYENNVLHEIIRKRHGGGSVSQESAHTDSESVNDGEFEEAEVSEEDGEDFEVSEEFIQFLRANAKYKESARLERERLKAMQEEKVDEAMEEPVIETAETRQKTWEELYGESWPRISTLEMSLNSHFINESDKCKPVYWPNIPLNLS